MLLGDLVRTLQMFPQEALLTVDVSTSEDRTSRWKLKGIKCDYFPDDLPVVTLSLMEEEEE